MDKYIGKIEKQNAKYKDASLVKGAYISPKTVANFLNWNETRVYYSLQRLGIYIHLQSGMQTNLHYGMKMFVIIKVLQINRSGSLYFFKSVKQAFKIEV